MNGLSQRMRSAVRRGTTESELDEEIRLHLDLETERNVSLGLPPGEARRRALVAFGGVENVNEAHRDGRGMPLPFADPSRLVMLWEENAEKDWHEQLVAPANALDWKERVTAFEDVALYNGGIGSATLTGEGAPRLLRQNRVSGNFFSVLGARAELGRTLRPDETWSNGSHVAVLSHRAWVQQFGGDSAVVGRTIRLDGDPMAIVGVMPDQFAFPTAMVDLWTSFEWKADDRAQVWFRRGRACRCHKRTPSCRTSSTSCNGSTRRRIA